MDKIAVLIDHPVIRPEINFLDSPVPAKHKIHCPPPLIPDMQTADLKSVHIDKYQQIVHADMWSAVFSVIAFGKSVEIPTVQHNVSMPFDDDVVIGALRRVSRFRKTSFIGKHVAECMVCHPEFAVVEKNGEIRWDHNGLFNFIIAADLDTAASVCDCFPDFFVDCGAAVGLIGQRNSISSIRDTLLLSYACVK